MPTKKTFRQFMFDAPIAMYGEPEEREHIATGYGSALSAEHVGSELRVYYHSKEGVSKEILGDRRTTR